MESTVVTQGDRAGVSRSPQPLTAQTGAVRARDRGAALGRALAISDLFAALLVATPISAVLGADAAYAVAFGAIAAVVWPAVAFSVGIYAPDDFRSWASGVPEIPRLLLAVMLASWPLFAAAVILDLPEPGFAIALVALALLLLASMGHAVARATVHRMKSMTQRTVVLGSGVVASKLTAKLRVHKQFGLEPIGIVDDEVHESDTLDLPRLGAFEELDEVLSAHAVDRVIIAFSRASHEELLRCIRTCRDHGVAVDVIPRLFELLDGVRPLGQVGGLPILSIGTPRLTRSARIAKRGLDLVASVGALIVLAPPLAIIAIAIKIDSRGPIFFRQVRAGRNGSVFRLIKFRSMASDAEERKQVVARRNDLSDGVMFKIHEDPRVTRVGRILRRWSLDELPQLFNVVKGEMSLVGPRPLILPETDALDEDWHLRRLDLRPGLTGPWQVYGRSETPFQEMVRFDYQYVTGWSLVRDVEILLATVPAVLSGRGAY
jgi:exopolysaccharide biosynthesis polyprenyl glycosylphosphotransferase